MELLTLPSLKEFRFLAEETLSGVHAFSNQLQGHINRLPSKLEVLALCNFDFHYSEGQPLYTPISALIRTVGPTIRDIIIEPSARTRFYDPKQLIKNIVNCGTTLPSLESLQVYGPPNWWMNTLRELTTVGETFYERTGRIIRVILNARKCSGWWANELNELIGLQCTHPEDYDRDASLARGHDDLPPLFTEDTDRLISSMVNTSCYVVQVLTTEKEVSIDACARVIDVLLQYNKQRKLQAVQD